jgi:hypothetical protein
MKNDSAIEVVILEDGLHAKEVNRHGSERPKKYVFESSPAQHGVRVRQWEDAESRLRTFQIESVAMLKAYGTFPRDEKFKAEILSSGKIKIL